VHDVAMKREFEVEARTKDFGWEYDLFHHLKRFVIDEDRKIDRNQKIVMNPPKTESVA
jgi:hypothetical protein